MLQNTQHMRSGIQAPCGLEEVNARKEADNLRTVRNTNCYNYRNAACLSVTTRALQRCDLSLQTIENVFFKAEKVYISTPHG